MSGSNSVPVSGHVSAFLLPSRSRRRGQCGRRNCPWGRWSRPALRRHCFVEFGRFPANFGRVRWGISLARPTLGRRRRSLPLSRPLSRGSAVTVVSVCSMASEAEIDAALEAAVDGVMSSVAEALCVGRARLGGRHNLGLPTGFASSMLIAKRARAIEMAASVNFWSVGGVWRTVKHLPFCSF